MRATCQVQKIILVLKTTQILRRHESPVVNIVWIVKLLQNWS